AEPGGAVKVDHHDAEAVTGEHLGVPAVVEVVAEAALRSAVDEERHRRLAPGEPGRLDDVAVHGVALGALERELLVLAPRDRLDPRVVEMRDLANVGAIELDAVELDG